MVGAIVGDQVNLWLLIVIIYLVHGTKPMQVWRENRWAIPINVLVMSAGDAPQISKQYAEHFKADEA